MIAICFNVQMQYCYTCFYITSMLTCFDVILSCSGRRVGEFMAMQCTQIICTINVV
jgi:hypothetical protein